MKVNMVARTKTEANFLKANWVLNHPSIWKPKSKVSIRKKKTTKKMKTQFPSRFGEYYYLVSA